MKQDIQSRKLKPPSIATEPMSFETEIYPPKKKKNWARKPFEFELGLQLNNADTVLERQMKVGDDEVFQTSDESAE
jgi:hypothetical protein